jgi:hypothetical protein
MINDRTPIQINHFYILNSSIIGANILFLGLSLNENLFENINYSINDLTISNCIIRDD